MTVFVFGRIQNLYRIDAIDIDDDGLVFVPAPRCCCYYCRVRDVFVTLSYLLRFAILLLLLFLSNTDRVRGSVRVRGLVRYGTVTCCCCYCGCGDRCLGGMYSSGRESVRVRGPVQYCCLLYYTRPVCILCCCTTRSGVLLVPLLLPVPCVFFVVVLLVPSYYLFRFNYPSR